MCTMRINEKVKGVNMRRKLNLNGNSILNCESTSTSRWRVAQHLRPVDQCLGSELWKNS